MSCDNKQDWMLLTKSALELGVNHGANGLGPMTEQGLLLRLLAAHGSFFYRNGQAKALRAVYGAGYRGMQIARLVVNQ